MLHPNMRPTLHIPARGLRVGRYPPQPVSVLWPAPTLSPSFLLAQAMFEPTVSCINTSTILKPSYSSFLPAYEDGTNSVPKRRHIKFRRQGTTQKKAYNTPAFLQFSSTKLYWDITGLNNMSPVSVCPFFLSCWSNSVMTFISYRLKSNCGV